MNVGDLVIVNAMCAGVFLFNSPSMIGVVNIHNAFVSSDVSIVHMFADDVAIILDVEKPGASATWFKIVGCGGITGWISSNHVTLLQQYCD